MSFQDLREFIQLLEDRGQLRRIDAPVKRDLRDLELALDGRLDPSELSPIFQELHELPQVLEAHRITMPRTAQARRACVDIARVAPGRAAGRRSPLGHRGSSAVGARRAGRDGQSGPLRHRAETRSVEACGERVTERSRAAARPGDRTRDMINLALALGSDTLVVVDEAHEVAGHDWEHERRQRAREQEARPHERQLPRDHPLEPEERPARHVRD